MAKTWPAKYRVTIWNDQGASEQTTHSSKASVRSYVRRWDKPREMMLEVAEWSRTSDNRVVIYRGSPLAF